MGSPDSPRGVGGVSKCSDPPPGRRNNTPPPGRTHAAASPSTEITHNAESGAISNPYPASAGDLGLGVAD